MFKKAMFVASAIALLMLLLFGGKALSYLGTAVSELREKVENNIPLEFELERASLEISELNGVIRDLNHEIAKEEVEVEKLERKVVKADDELAQSKDDIMTLNAALQKDKEYYKFASSRTYSKVEVEEDLQRRFDHHKTLDDTNKMRKQTLEHRRDRLNAARKQLEETVNAKRQLEVEVAELQAQSKMLEVAQQTSELKVDNSQLARARESVEKIRTRLEVEAKMVDSQINLRPGIELHETEVRDIQDEVTNYFESSADIDSQIVGASEN